MNYGLTRLVIALVVISAGAVGWYVSRGNAGAEVFKVAQEVVAHADGYKENKEFFDWLVKDAHEGVFNDSYHGATRSRGTRQAAWVEFDKYIDDLFARMISNAKDQSATGVATALEKLKARLDAGEDLDAPPKQDPSKPPSSGPVKPLGSG